MAESVTYADLRFVKAPLKKRVSSQPGQDPEADDDGELTYENVQVPTLSGGASNLASSGLGNKAGMESPGDGCLWGAVSRAGESRAVLGGQYPWERRGAPSKEKKEPWGLLPGGALHPPHLQPVFRTPSRSLRTHCATDPGACPASSERGSFPRISPPPHTPRFINSFLGSLCLVPLSPEGQGSPTCWKYLLLGLLLTCLLLGVAAIALGVRYLQVSQQLQHTSRALDATNSSLRLQLRLQSAQLGQQERELQGSRRELAQTREALQVEQRDCQAVRKQSQDWLAGWEETKEALRREETQRRDVEERLNRWRDTLKPLCVPETPKPNLEHHHPSGICSGRGAAGGVL
ncbi:B-cell differentiation antigen CD72 [Myotis lucifugus]|uniref:B-cell differentiation antigen CD72 n=1 Tax=Myotis lucifugus TaxID=59463 RepID=UPI000CCBFC50|nr:B-cell differentiation antigen CD72 [Myotis lucifugus]